MTCDTAAPLVAAAADGSLDPQRRRALDAHLAGCAQCRAALEEQRLVASVLASAPIHEASADFLRHVNARIDAAEGSIFGVADFRTWTLRLAPLAAVLALIAWLAPGTSGNPAASATSTGQSLQTFAPADAADWQRDVPANALLEAAVSGALGDRDAR